MENTPSIIRTCPLAELVVCLPHCLDNQGSTVVDVFQAALLHDTVEDTNTTIEEIAQEFGQTVAGKGDFFIRTFFFSFIVAKKLYQS